MNKKQVQLILSDIGLRRFMTIPTFKNLLAYEQVKGLKQGLNLLVVNHFIFSKLKNLTDNEIQLVEIIKKHS